jgi:glycosyltransferase involved in cell wall biosynthesis
VSQSSQPGVSVVIPCYNGAAFLRETLDCVLSQELDGPVEVLVGDDASTDGSRDIAESYDGRVRWIHSPFNHNTTTAATRNRCLAASTQPFVAFLDADDLWLPGHLKSLRAILIAQPDVGLAYDKGYYMSSDGHALSPFLPYSPPPTTADELLPSTCFAPGQVMVRSSVFDRVGRFDESLKHSEDQDMWLRILEAFPASHLPQFGFKYRIHDGQKSLKPAVWTCARQVLENARRRYPYQRSSIRKRKAILAYRFSQIAQRERRYLAAAWRLAEAAYYNPGRALAELTRGPSGWHNP